MLQLIAYFASSSDTSHLPFDARFYLGKVFGSDEDTQDDDASSGDTSADVKLSGDELNEITKEVRTYS